MGPEKREVWGLETFPILIKLTLLNLDGDF